MLDLGLQGSRVKGLAIKDTQSKHLLMLLLMPSLLHTSRHKRQVSDIETRPWLAGDPEETRSRYVRRLRFPTVHGLGFTGPEKEKLSLFFGRPRVGLGARSLIKAQTLKP